MKAGQYIMEDSTIISCQFINNTAYIGGGGIGSGYYGGTPNSTLNVVNSSFTGNNARTGGALFLNQGIGNINNCDFASNNATYAGALLNFDNLIVNNCKFTLNSATNQGGALLNIGSVNMTNCAFTNNTSNNGSAICNFYLFNITNSTFTKNNANLSGTIFNTGIINSTNCKFITNTGNLGSVMFNTDINGTAIMNFNSITGNTTSKGYSIYNTGGTVNATLNWWGSANGPSTGDVYGNVTTTPWLTITAKTSLNGGIYNTNQIIILSLIENTDNNGTIYYTLDGSTPTNTSSEYNNPITITKNTILKYMAVDTAGYSSQIYTQTYTIDKIPPTVVSTNPTNNSKNIPLKSSITIKFSENIIAGANYSKDLC